METVNLFLNQQKPLAILLHMW